MPGVSIHVVDVSRGLVAVGMQVEFFSLHGASPLLIAGGRLGAAGTLNDPALAGTFAIGAYRATFHLGAYYRGAGIVRDAIPFLDIVHYDFGIAAPQQHYHLPFKCTPWGYSCFRGGA